MSSEFNYVVDVKIIPIYSASGNGQPSGAIIQTTYST